MTALEAKLLDVLALAQTRGYLGPGDPAEHLAHAGGFGDAAEEHLGNLPDRFADLGTGGGVPGLALAARWTESRAALIESSARRCEALEGWVRELRMEDRVEVLHGRPERWAHETGYREAFEIVTARSFARAAITAEIAAGLVRIGGAAVVSDPPAAPDERWPVAGLRLLGFGPAQVLVERGAHYACLPKVRAAEAGTPRSEGRPAKRPRW